MLGSVTSRDGFSWLRNRKDDMGFLDLLKMPESRCVEGLDDRTVTLVHAQILQRKPFMKNLYADFYNQLKASVPEPDKKTIVELGSGGGFIKEIIPNAITSDVLDLPNVDKAFSACQMPFENVSVDAIVMFDVLHHIPEPRAFFKEALRCLKVGGKIIMIEPANTLWSRFIYKNFHHEGFDTKAGWTLEKGSPLWCGNDAMPWIIFSRDRKIFEKEFPSLKIVRIRHHTPMRYLLSGGFTLRQLVPSFTYSFFKIFEITLWPLNGLLGMFQTIELEKTR
jgi:SAM-dependent methyltransferase